MLENSESSGQAILFTDAKMQVWGIMPRPDINATDVELDTEEGEYTEEGEDYDEEIIGKEKGKEDLLNKFEECAQERTLVVSSNKQVAVEEIDQKRLSQMMQ